MEKNYHEFTALPVWQQAVWIEPGKLANDADPYKWSGNEAPPAIGAEVKILCNGLGAATVTRYFAEYGWLGLLVRLHNPPEWFRKQNAEWKTKPCHVFGVDLNPRKVTQ